MASMATQSGGASRPAASLARTTTSRLVVTAPSPTSSSGSLTISVRLLQSPLDVKRVAWLRGTCADPPVVASPAFAASASRASVTAPSSVRPLAAASRRHARRASRKPSDLSANGPAAQRRLGKTAAAGAAGPAGSPGERVRAEATASGAGGGQSWDVVGVGQAMVDFAAMVDDDFLRGLALAKGSRTLVDHEERGRVLRALDGCSYKLSAGGSLSNTLVALARLGAAAASPSAAPGSCSATGGTGNGVAAGGGSALRVAMTGSVGGDPLGEFYRTKLRRANVHFLSKPMADGTTGTVVVLTTPDAQRTMLAYQGMSSVVRLDAALRAAVSSARVVVVEGYLWDLPCTVHAISAACHAAKATGALVALTGSDVTCIARHRPQFWEVMSESADILFANGDEACALLDCPPSTCPAWAALQLSRYCPLVSVTDGAKGAYIAHRGAGVTFVPSAPCHAVDTCGAGDAYAAGLLYGLLACGAQGLSDMELQQELRLLWKKNKARERNTSSRSVGISSSDLMSSSSPMSAMSGDAAAMPLHSSFPTSLPATFLSPCSSPSASHRSPDFQLAPADVAAVGGFAARVAAMVVGQQGARLSEDAAAELVGWWAREEARLGRRAAVESTQDLVLE
ncbi:hypothetical protein CLOM_g20897 [Closterium sp. NIES-68]|nr:hypothetical protein CLOM_g20897 [Closterium sp. NIES-68]GJP81804.1 hypothetical protein CLOP_g11930 [Closterium sp. NIES-67]